MKCIFSLLLVFSFNLSFSQMTVSEMVKIYKMNFDEFETYAIKKGYDFLEVDKSDNVNGVTYTKGFGINTKYLSLRDIFYDDGVTVHYQTSNKNEFINLKNQIKSLGFSLHESDTYKGDQIKEYRNKLYKITIFTIPISANNQNDRYEINLQKLK